MTDFIATKYPEIPISVKQLVFEFPILARYARDIILLNENGDLRDENMSLQSQLKELVMTISGDIWIY